MVKIVKQPTPIMQPRVMIRAWTYGYFPFKMGGSPWQPIAADVEADGPHDIGKGMQAYLVTAPSGKTYVAEAVSGAFVGPSLERVRKDVRAGGEDMMAEQLRRAAEVAPTARVISADELWRMLKEVKRENAAT